MRKLKIIYAGSPLASSIVLKGLIASQSECGFKIAGVLTNPPSTRGRHSDLIPTEVAVVARENNIPVFEFDNCLLFLRLRTGSCQTHLRRCRALLLCLSAP